MEDKKDERFSNIWRDPRFKPVSKRARKVQIDKRFESMFTDDKFKMKFIDKRGRSIQETSTENLKKFYELTSSGEDDDDEEQQEETDEEEKGNRLAKSMQKEFECQAAESGSTTSEESDLEADNEEFDHKWGEMANDAPEIDKPTNRFAICNMDWDRIKAEDLMVLLNSFKPPDGTVKSVKIYPSEFGIQRMKEEEVKGPKELVENVLQSDEEDEANTEEGSEYHREKLRQYQINRLKYYFAIVECDSPETASIIYKDLDGIEYESSAVTIDLRFVPDDMTFEQEPSSVSMSLPNMSAYKPSLFTTTALQHMNVQLTWDETNPERIRAMKDAFEKKEQDPKNVNLSAFLASSSSSEDDAKDDVERNVANFEEIKGSSMKKKVQKYKELLQNVENEGDRENKDVELEISWEPGLQTDTKDLVKKSKQKTEDMTPWEQYLNKRKEKKKQKKKEKSSQSVQDSENSDSEENEISQKGSSVNEDMDKNDIEALAVVEDKQRRRKKKLKRKKEMKVGNTKELESFQLNLKDPRFTALYTSHLYNIEPANPHFKETEGMKAILEEKKRRRKEVSTCEKADKDSGKIPEVASLVTSIKQKSLANMRKRKKN